MLPYKNWRSGRPPVPWAGPQSTDSSTIVPFPCSRRLGGHGFPDDGERGTRTRIDRAHCTSRDQRVSNVLTIVVARRLWNCQMSESTRL